MKQALLLPVLLTLLHVGPLRAMSPSEAGELSAAAQQAYAEGDHRSALDLFDSVATVYSSATLYYNLGNCHFKLGDIPRAILNYERALRLDPGAEDVQANLDLARLQVVDRINELPGFALGATWGRLRGGNDVDQWARRALWGSLALFLALAIALLAPMRWLRRTAYGLAVAFLALAVISSAFAAWRAAEVRDSSEAIILAAKVDARSEPRKGSPVLFALHKGTKITVLQEQDGWNEVKLPNGSVGWMPPGTLERI